MEGSGGSGASKELKRLEALVDMRRRPSLDSSARQRQAERLEKSALQATVELNEADRRVKVLEQEKAALMEQQQDLEARQEDVIDTMSAVVDKGVPVSNPVYNAEAIGIGAEFNHEPGTGQYPPFTGQYPPLTGQYPPITGQYPPGTGQYPPITGQHQPGTGQYPPGTGQYPPITGQFQPGTGQYQPGTGRYQPITGQWKDGVCSCFDQCVPTCVGSFCCFPCLTARFYDQFVKRGSYWFVLLVLLGLGILYFISYLIADSNKSLAQTFVLISYFSRVLGVVAAILFVCQIRQAVRNRFRIPGGGCDDCLLSWCCQGCVLAQIYRHVTPYKGGCDDCNCGDLCPVHDDEVMCDDGGSAA